MDYDLAPRHLVYGSVAKGVKSNNPAIKAMGGDNFKGDNISLTVVAKNDKSHHGLSDQFAAHGRDGRLERSYLAIVWGVPERRQGTISAAIDRSHSRSFTRSMGRNSQGEPAFATTMSASTTASPI